MSHLQVATIRQGRDSDGPGVVALVSACWGEYASVVIDIDAEAPELHALATHMAERGGAFWVGEADGRVVGSVATRPAQDGWHLSRMYVAPGQRGTGLAADLLGRAETHARVAGGDAMVLWTDTLFTRAHAFYEKRGYIRRGGLRALQDLSHSVEARYWKPLAGRVVQELDVAAAESAERALAGLLQACTEAGGLSPLAATSPPQEAGRFWHDVTGRVGRGQTRLLGAWRDGTLAGCVQFEPDVTEGGRHRGTLHTLLVAPGDRCQGVARLLLRQAEALAAAAGLTLLLMLVAADEHAAPVYRKLGWQEAGSIPGYVRSAAGHGRAAQLLFRELRPEVTPDAE